MSRTAQIAVGTAVLVVLVAAMAYFALQRDSGVAVVLVAVVLLGAAALSVYVSRKQ